MGASVLQVWDVSQHASEVVEGTESEVGTRHLLDTGEDSCCRQIGPFCLILCRLEALIEILLGGCLLLESTVRGDDLLCLFLIEVVVYALVEFGLGLGEELLVVDVAREVDGSCELHTEEATAARGVCQHVSLVGGTDERGHALELFDVLAVGTLHLHRRQGDHVLEESLLQRRRDLVELVEADEQELTHRLQRLFLLTDVELVGVAPLQLRRQQRLDEGGLVPALGRDEQGRHLVAVTLERGGLPLVYHA